MGETFWQAAARDPDRVALVGVDGREHAAAALLAAGNRIAHALRDSGVANGDRVDKILTHGVATIELLLATQQIGLYLTPLNTQLRSPEIAYILRDAKAQAFFAHASLSRVAGEAAREAGLPPERSIAVGGAIEGMTSLDAFVAGAADALPSERTAGQFLQYTSGTTGKPKGVRRAPIPLDPDLVWPQLAAHLGRFGIEPGGGAVHLVTSPMYHTAPLVFGFFSLHFGHRVVLMEKWDAERFLVLVERERVTTTHMVPTQFQRLLRLPAATRARYDVSSLRHVLHAAAPCPIDTKRRMIDWLGPVVFEYYGATEGGGTLVTPAEWLERPGTVGRAWAGAEIRILDAHGEPCPPSVPGSVYLKLQQDFRYEGDEAKTQAARRGDFFSVGDVGWLDADGFLFLCDRAIDMIIAGGVNIYPAEIEAVLLADAEVADAAAFGIPDDDWGEAVHAVVEPLDPSAGPDLSERLLALCRERLAAYKCPRRIELSPALPRDPNGKLYKRKLRDPYWMGRDRRI